MSDSSLSNNYWLAASIGTDKLSKLSYCFHCAGQLDPEPKICFTSFREGLLSGSVVWNGATYRFDDLEDLSSIVWMLRNG